MVDLDMRTVFTSYLVVTVVCAVVVSSLWRDNRSRSSGIGYWAVDYLFQSLGLLLIVLRGAIPDFISIVVANVLIYGGTALLLVGLEKYVDRPGRQWHNAVALGVFTGVQIYFAYVDVSLTARNINGALMLVFLCSQIAWLMLHRVDVELKPATQPVGLVMVGFVAAATSRIVADLTGEAVVSIFDAPLPDSVIILVNQLLFVALTFSIVVMVNRRLLVQLGSDIRRRVEVERALRRSEAKFSAAFQTIPDAVLISVMETGELIEVNESFYRITGYTRDQIQGRTTLDIGLWMRPDDRLLFVEAMEADGRVDRIHVQFRRADGEAFSAELSSEILQVEELTCVLTVFRDVTEEELSKQRLSERTEELVRSNRDLEQFAYVASHDLQEPLRMVINYTQLMQRRYAGRLDSDADDFMGFALEGAHRMHVLITELLAYSRVQSTGKEPTRTDLEEALRGATINLAAAIDESGATVTHDPLPFALCDKTQVVQVFQNLIGNALKFHGAEPPRIHVGAVRFEDTWTISVKDNGIGIESEYFDQVFQIYRRLGARSEYPGTGMGLAICKRILERHGQQIWVESTPGEGSTFFFTLSAVPDQD